MFILRDLLTSLQAVFPTSEEGLQRRTWFACTLLSMVVPFTPSRTSNLLRSLRTLFGLEVDESCYYTFMASKKLPWHRLWATLWRLIPDPLTEGRLLVALDDSINPKTGQKIFACQHHFDHAAKHNQRRYPWSQKIVSIGLLKSIKGRWCCLPLAFEFYFMKKHLQAKAVTKGKRRVEFRTKFEQATRYVLPLGHRVRPCSVLVGRSAGVGSRTRGEHALQEAKSAGRLHFCVPVPMSEMSKSTQHPQSLTSTPSMLIFDDCRPRATSSWQASRFETWKTT